MDKYSYQRLHNPKKDIQLAVTSSKFNHFKNFHQRFKMKISF